MGADQVHGRRKPQFLRGIDKSGLAPGLLYALRFVGAGQPREDFVLNQPAFAGTDVLLAGAVGTLRLFAICAVAGLSLGLLVGLARQ